MESGFQFTNPSLTSLEFRSNDEFAKSSEEISIQINMSVSVQKSETQREARVALTLELGEEGKDIPFFIKAVEEANFRWNETVDERVEALLNQNAPALLLSYLRPIVTQITAASPFEAFDIPFMNFKTAK